MAGNWQGTREPGIYRQDGASGTRYKYAFRDARGVVTSKTFPRIKDAQALKNSMGVRRTTGDLPDVSKSKKTLTDAWDHLEKTGRQRASTFASYKTRWTQHIAPVLGDRQLVSIRRPELEAFYSEIESKTTLDTRRKVQQVVHKLFAVALRAEWISRNPADGIEMPGAEPKIPPRKRFLSVEQVEKIVDEIEPRYRAFIWTLALGGLRPGEACALRVRNARSPIYVEEGKTEGSTRDVPVHERLWPILTEHLSTFSNRFDPESLVFTTELGYPISQNNFLRRVFKPAVLRAGVLNAAGVVPVVYDLRHTAATEWLRLGFSEWEVAGMLGHTTPAMVRKVYGGQYPDALQKKMALLSAGG
jgi:integrase